MKILDSIELFSGAGGLALGLHAAGFRHRALYEWNASAVETLQYNQRMGHPSLSDCTITRADVRDVDFRFGEGTISANAILGAEFSSIAP
ncbi:MAG: DNA cytosine methyltransferase [Akkermansiaceae bacterium]|jgi:DNA (cytosine-5)-methyltransferase 1|nr:DNA cytosine methyltransferase [Akkermansiaceae bacterium]MDP4778948.1 DNA cytosine methyltransferase [Akkermansiaceae bacterium]MDP4896342.1 DNA cytosine methyltransferase [Akkermansiaceae bacterium]